MQPSLALPIVSHGGPVKTILAAITGILALGLGAAPPTILEAHAADQYDGKWVGTAPDAGDCGVLTVAMVIGGSTITGNVSGNHGSVAINSGKVEADGTGTREIHKDPRLRGHIEIFG